MKWIRALHLGVAVTVPAFGAVGWGVCLRLAGRSRKQILRGMMRVVGHSGPALAGLKIQCDGRDRLDIGEQAIYLFNHQSGLDPVIVCSLLPHETVGIAKRAFKSNPVLGPLLRFTNSIFVAKGPGWREYLLEQAKPVIAEGYSIAIAPEGTRLSSRRESSKPLAVGQFRLGAFYLAQAYQLPLIPIVIHDSAERLPARSTQLKAGQVHVSVLEARRIQAHETPEQIAEEMEQLYANCLASR